MSLVVQKFGGTSLGTSDHIADAADRIVSTAQTGQQVVVVVSAMGSTTDDLTSLAHRIHPDPPGRELDMLLTAGERISMSLTAMALAGRGVEAVSLTGSQAGILTDSTHGEAKITRIQGTRIRQALQDGKVVVVAGFQGVNPDNREVTTLGRGGSDTTAVALAAALEAEVCEIYTDVDGVFSANPRLVPEAHLLSELSYEEMLEMSAAGAEVLMTRSVEFGRRFGIPIHVRSAFQNRTGTWIKEKTMEQAIISGIASDTSEAKVTVREVPDRPGVAARLFEPLAETGINVDMIVQNVSQSGTTDISFTIPMTAVASFRNEAEKVKSELGASGVEVDTEVAKVSLVGAGMKAHPGVAAGVFRALADGGINIEMISTSAIRVSCVIRVEQLEHAVQVLHQTFDPPTLSTEMVGMERA